MRDKYKNRSNSTVKVSRARRILKDLILVWLVGSVLCVGEEGSIPRDADISPSKIMEPVLNLKLASSFSCQCSFDFINLDRRLTKRPKPKKLKS